MQWCVSLCHYLFMNKTFVVTTKKLTANRTPAYAFAVIRQIPGHDRIYKVGDKLPGYGNIVEIKPNV